jgi:ABC-2 type transport system ATP-binding protein
VSPSRRRRGELELRGVGKDFEGTSKGLDRLTVLEGIDLTIGPDESVGLIGPNGAGKSTLLKLMAGVSPPSSGTIERRGVTCSVIELGAAVHADLTGRENIELLASLYGMPRALMMDRFDTIVEFAELEHAIDLPTRQYSTGMVARLAFSTAAHSNPDLLLIDEVLSVGDLPFQFRCRDRVEELRRDGTTVVLVSHDLDLIAAVCDRAVLLRDAHVEADGHPSRMISRYLGLPERSEEGAPISVEVRPERIRAGETFEFAVELSGDGPADVGIDLVIAEHPTLAAHGIEQSVICATDRVHVDRRRATFRVGTPHLPPGRYEIHARLDPDGATVRASAAPIILTGPRPAPYTAFIDAEITTRPEHNSSAKRST